MSSHQPSNNQRGVGHNARISAAPYVCTLKCFSCKQIGHKFKGCKFTPKVVPTTVPADPDRYKLRPMGPGEQTFNSGPQQQQTRFNNAPGQGYSRGGGGDGGQQFEGRAAPGGGDGRQGFVGVAALGGNPSNNLRGNDPSYGSSYGLSTSYASNNSGAGGIRPCGNYRAFPDSKTNGGANGNAMIDN